MSCVNRCKLPKVNKFELVKCIKITMDNGEQYTIKTNDLVAVQFVKNDKTILVRRGRIKEIVTYARKALSTHDDCVSHIILDCSAQFSIQILEIKIKDIIKIGGIDDEFDDYSDRIKQLEPNYIEGNRVPTREHGMLTKEEMIKKVTKPNKDNVVKMNSDTGEFDDLYEMNANRPDIEELRIPVVNEPEPEPVKKEQTKPAFRGIPIMM